MDIIRLLPDSVANQIAAGEVIQRPASCLKELVENSLDAGATHIQVIVRDAGRTLLQVIDNGSGMSETDARMAFERHATSKIKEAADLFRPRCARPPSPEPLPSVAGEGFWMRQPLFLIPARQRDKSDFTSAPVQSRCPSSGFRPRERSRG